MENVYLLLDSDFLWKIVYVSFIFAALLLLGHAGAKLVEWFHEGWERIINEENNNSNGKRCRLRLVDGCGGDDE